MSMFRSSGHRAACSPMTLREPLKDMPCNGRLLPVPYGEGAELVDELDVLPSSHVLGKED